MNIGEAADAAGVSAKMIRHYEQIGLLPEAIRTEAGYRQYGPREVSILRFIRQARRLGFSIEQVGGLLGLWSQRDRSSREVKALAQQHLQELEDKLQELQTMKQALEQLVQACAGDEHAHCAILDGLAVASPSAPEPGSVATKPIKAAKAASAPKPAAGDGHCGQHEAAAHQDLMAWTRSFARSSGPG
ncbi:Cu(I)-responsive transcriptional regulator [Inhella sp. 1Y17]|uniref:Cu(I)-responsive transcriptional regulator n=1 Tax=Inhella proteolytica TaxID=2795029 RepID=A0A931NH74_9BURK|nr:Cu(I)-responsive transcriptional regulator [Inhella proteolytica]